MNNYNIKHLTKNDVILMRSLLNLFGNVFHEVETYCNNQPTDNYLSFLLDKDYFITLVALDSENTIMGGLAAYELHKFEQQRSEVYIYDLAVETPYRRKGVATALIQAIKKIAGERGAYIIYVQADYVDKPAIELYTKLGIREDVLHFDIEVHKSNV